MRTPRAERRLPSAIVALVSLLTHPLPSLAAPPDRTVLYADRDDDDANGTPDGEQASVPRAPELLSIPLPSKIPPSATVALRSTCVRVLADGQPLAPGAPIPPRARRLEIQALCAGRAEVDVLGKTYRIGAVELRAVDGDGKDVSLARGRASLQRTPPDRLGDDPYAPSGDPDALRFVVIGHADDLPSTLSILSLSPAGTPVDALVDLPLGDVPCPAGAPSGATCGSTLPIRAVADDIDRNHPLCAGRSIRAELGGALAVTSGRVEKEQMIRVAGPRSSPAGPIERYRATLRVRLVRLVPHGPPPLGGDDARAIEVAKAEVARANALWAACGISFGPLSELDVAVVDPPRPHMIALGCDHGLPASGGLVRVRVEGREVSVKIARGTLPRAAARALAAAIGRAGLDAQVIDNPVIGAGAFGSSDVLVRRRDGSLAVIEPPLGPGPAGGAGPRASVPVRASHPARPASGPALRAPAGAIGPVSTDATMTACIGRVDLEDGLQHFGDVDAIAGTVEERALIRAFDDGDPRTVEVFFVPSFAGGGRIGESFIFGDGGAIRNVLIEDRGGLRADRASFALAHELGHVLLDDPGHPDDFGVDTPTRLMDADAANASAYGPRRLLVSECARALRQSGPGAPVPLLRRWPLGPLGR
jgi:hypothetical protein